MTITFLVPISFPDSEPTSPASILEEAQAIEDALLHGGFDVGEVHPYARPSIGLTPQTQQTLPPVL